jgi:hypothetical protein
MYFFFFFLWLYNPIWASAASIKLSVSLQLLYLGQSAQLLGLVISSSQGLCLYTDTETRTLNIHTRGSIRTEDHSVQASENISCLKSLGYCDPRSGGRDPHFIDLDTS